MNNYKLHKVSSSLIGVLLNFCQVFSSVKLQGKMLIDAIRLLDRMKLLKEVISAAAILILLVRSPTYATEQKSYNMQPIAGLTYECHKKDKHIIHVLEVNPKYFHIELVKAHNQVFGRETVRSIALRKGAFAAINAGFFEIGNSEDGRPSRTLIIDGQIFSFTSGIQGLLFMDNNNLDIKKAKAGILLKIGKHKITPSKVNEFADKGDIVLYSSKWGPSSLTPKNFKEILISSDHIVAEISNSGDNAIRPREFILSFSPDRNFPDDIQIGDKVSLELEFLDPISKTPIIKNKAASIITGIPVIVQDGKVVASLVDIKPTLHARTAIGVKPNGNILMVVVEHFYTKSLQQVTLEEVNTILKKRQDVNIATATIPEVRKILMDNFIENSNIIGFNFKELAEYMVELGCNSAINLDGGGSSTMFLDGNIVNSSVGDEDESLGQRIVRPVSDAIVLIPNK